LSSEGKPLPILGGLALWLFAAFPPAGLTDTMLGSQSHNAKGYYSKQVEFIILAVGE